MFRDLTLRGPSATLVFGYRTAAALTTWALARRVDTQTNTYAWTLTAMLGTPVDRFQLRQRPLLFTVPRRGGFGVWPVQTLQVGERSLVATLGPPEH